LIEHRSAAAWEWFSHLRTNADLIAPDEKDMKNRIIRNNSMIALAVLVLAAASLQLGTGWLQLPKARAQLQDGSVVFVSDSISGIIPGQAARISVAHLADPRSVEPLYFQCKVFDQNGALLFQSERLETPPGQFRYLDIFRRDLNVDGEPKTGRVQMSMAVFVFLPHGRKSDVSITGEVLDEQTGETAYNWGYAILPFIEQDPVF
jgi:hypothetical protein